MEQASRKQRANKLVLIAENWQIAKSSFKISQGIQELYAVYDLSRSANPAFVALKIESQKNSQVSQARLLSSSAKRQTIRAE
jgi:hypothetical protein